MLTDIFLSRSFLFDFAFYFVCYFRYVVSNATECSSKIILTLIKIEVFMSIWHVYSDYFPFFRSKLLKIVFIEEVPIMFNLTKPEDNDVAIPYKFTFSPFLENFI